MGLFWNRGQRVWDLGTVQPPWEPRPSIYGHIRDHVVPGQPGLAEGGETLPDERDDGGLKFASGAMDGAFGHHYGGTDDARAKLLHRTLTVVLDDASPRKLDKLYRLLVDGSALESVDALLDLIVDGPELDAERLEQLAVWLATKAPDREPVKLGIALLGIITGSDHRGLLMTLGRHEELTLYVAVALQNTSDPEAGLFELARLVDGWGRIQLVERLAATENPAIKAWMLREGYKNSIMYEYLAHVCATTGGLAAALQADHVDADLLLGAAELLSALIWGGPAADIDDYDDAIPVVDRYLLHLGPRPDVIAHLLTVASIRSFVTERAQAWPQQVRARIRHRCNEIVSLPHWRTLVERDLDSDDPRTFHAADQAARDVGVDPWPRHLARLEAGRDDSWFDAMRTDDPARIDRVLELASRRIPLDEIATGAADELGLGLDWQHHGNLNWVLEGLHRFPGKGWSFIRAGANSPVVRNRSMAVRALAAWDRGAWPADAEPYLTGLRDREPDEDVRAWITKLLLGQPLEDD